MIGKKLFGSNFSKYFWIELNGYKKIYADVTSNNGEKKVEREREKGRKKERNDPARMNKIQSGFSSLTRLE